MIPEINSLFSSRLHFYFVVATSIKLFPIQPMRNLYTFNSDVAFSHGFIKEIKANIIFITDEFSSQSDSSADLSDVRKHNNNTSEMSHKYIGKCRALYTYEARLDDELTLTPGIVTVWFVLTTLAPPAVSASLLFTVYRHVVPVCMYCCKLLRDLHLIFSFDNPLYM